ncbi:MAG: HAD family hydrolase [Muribaculaceae bacterium]|nr:HAD family hydrolase [Muribaculaceae bacterium]MDE7081264.1 HAD family hydrolase [Muribaculaceae bacterium]
MNTPYDFNYHGPVVVFDLDDTLLRERDYCRSGFRLIEQHLASSYPAMQGIASRMEHQLNNRADYFTMLEDELSSLIPDALRRKEEMERLVSLYRNHTPDHLPYTAGAEETLRLLQHHGVVMALITDGRSGTQRCKIAALHLDRYIRDADILISEETGSDKSRPDNFQAIVRRYPEASRFIYIADNPRKDFLMPNMLGWLTCQVPYDADNVHPLPEGVAPEYGATRILAEIGEVAGLAGVKSYDC